MNKIKEVTVFTNGDSRKISTWSNVPYFFTETLISKGIKVNRVDISPPYFLERVYNKTFWRVLKIINKNSSYNYFRTFAHYIDVKRRIRKALEKYNNSDANIFLTFSFSSAGLTNKPTILFSDWTYDYYFKYFLNRQPDSLERSCIKREDQEIEASDLVFALFPRVADYMKNHYENKNIFYLGNVVNSLLDVAKSEVLKQKSFSQDILFIGSKKYIEGAKYLIEAYTSLKEKYPQLSLNIVGMQDKDFVKLPDGVNCYGYLDKAKEKDRELYYSLLVKAKVFVNTTPKWGTPSAMLEAMYFYTPVVVTAYDEFVETFGVDINFGYYCENNSIALLCSKISNVFENESYESLCINAHKSVENYTWSSYIDKLLVRIDALTQEKIYR
ncbi:glycosyltransferase [Nostoc sp. UHCC 0702]|nr:glycosyltransferase [Nostoc sp. UHCC 0702]